MIDSVHYSSVKEEVNVISPQTMQVVMEANQLPGIVLKRLMEEVKNDNLNPMFAYDRAHNRHNRGR